jgi:hypothetical protein
MNQVLTLGGRAGTARLRGLDPPVGIMQAQPRWRRGDKLCMGVCLPVNIQKDAVAGRAADV